MANGSSTDGEPMVSDDKSLEQVRLYSRIFLIVESSSCLGFKYQHHIFSPIPDSVKQQQRT